MDFFHKKREDVTTFGRMEIMCSEDDIMIRDRLADDPIGTYMILNLNGDIIKRAGECSEADDRTYKYVFSQVEGMIGRKVEELKEI